MTLVAIVVDGVLRQDSGDGVIPSGLLLYNTLKETARLALLTDDERPQTHHWLKVNGFVDHMYVIPPTALGLGSRETRKRQIRRLYKEGNNLAFVVEPDPEVAACLLQEGFPVMLAMHPKYSRPSFRPDYDEFTTPWSVLTEEVDRQRDLRAKDRRNDMEAL